MTKNQEMGFGFQERQVLWRKVFEEAGALLIICHLGVKHSRHKDYVGLRVVMHSQGRNKNLLNPPQIHHCRQTQCFLRNACFC